MNLTTKQRQILDTVIKGNPDGTWLDFDQLIQNVPYETTKGSMHFSIRALVGKKLLVKNGLEFRRGQMRSVIAPTSLAYELRKSAT